MKNKPSANFSEGMLRKHENTLNQKGMQMWLLVRSFPFLVYEKVTATNNECVGLVVLLIRIMELVFAPKL